jgi:(1->4)-alpha-D-glucan 1-alpha-D-glucosylmutase
VSNSVRERPTVVPRATYRLQLTPSFGFDEAAAVAPYLAALGVSHLYSSPYLQAAPGSTHGYDVVNPHHVNIELGGPVAHHRFRRTLGDHRLGQVLDTVPNHMAISGPDNPWWGDVLENGPASRYARYFDVEWASADEHSNNKVLLPLLGDHYGRVLEAGELLLARDGGTFSVHYHEHRFPVAPPSLEPLLVDAGRRASSDELVFIGGAMGRLPPVTATDRESLIRRNRDKEVLKVQVARLAHDHPEVARALDEVVAEVNADEDALDALLERQNYRLAFWRAAGEDLGYRRFFDITTLIGLRMEDEYVFRDTHELVLGWLREGVLDGVRIDHPDGLRDPRQYLQRLRAASRRAWIVVEKILEPSEELPRDWPVAGTSGYDFLNLAGGLFVDPAAEASMTDIYRSFSGVEEPFEEIAHAKKQQVLQSVLVSEFNRLTVLFAEVVRGHRRHRDYPPSQLRSVLLDVIASFPVYRTYARAEAGEISAADIRHIETAFAAAGREQDHEPELLSFLRDVLTLRIRGAVESEFVMRFQQLTGPVMAKGVEDTAFYTYNRLISLNEVGGSPDRFGVTLEEWHAAQREAHAHWPASMLTTATHDTKRSEDVRARIAVLSEVPEQWREAVGRWAGMNEGKRSGERPDRNTEYFLYQTLAGTWPITLERLWPYMEKAAREAKTFTSWTDPDLEYEKVLRRFVEGCLGDEAFVGDLERFLAPLLPSARATSLSQILLKLTAVGVPDIYQGTELWDHSLVDPDNRRPVDFALRRSLLERARAATAEEALAEMEEGLPKLWLIHRVLQLRARRPELFGSAGTYQPLWADGSKADHVVAFARGGEAVVVAQRLIHRLGDGWNGTSLQLPSGPWIDQLTGERHDGGGVPLARLLERFPAALLMPEHA